MDSILSLKAEHESFSVEYDILTPHIEDRDSNVEREIQEIDNQLLLCQKEVDALNEDIDRLTNHSDGLDYAIAALSGILTGIIDAFFIGDWNVAEARAWSSEEINHRITEFANKDPEYLEFIQKKEKQNGQFYERNRIS